VRQPESRSNLHLVSRRDDDTPPRDRDWDDETPAAVAERRPGVRRVLAWTIRLVAAALFVAAGAALYLAPTRSARQPAPLVETPAKVLPQSETAPSRLAIDQPAVPAVDILVMLIRTAIVALHQANVTGNYALLREISAPDLQNTQTPASLTQAFAPLRDNNVDLGSIAVYDPSLITPPQIGPDGILRLNGFFASERGQINFALGFRVVNAHWRLVGINVTPSFAPFGAAAPAPASAPPTARKVPDDTALITLIRTAIVCLNQANATGDYSVLRQIAAANFQNSNSLDKLTAAFTALRQRNLDLSPVTVIAPRLFKKPAIDDNGYLRLTGYFPTRPEQVNFDLAFQFEGGRWRLFGIGVNTSRETPPAPPAPPAPVR